MWGEGMKIIQLLSVIILIAAVVLCGCNKTKTPAEFPEEPIPEGEPMEITSFSFTHTGMSTEECFQYEVEETENGIILHTEELFSGGFVLDTLIEEPILEQLGEITGRYRMDLWNGFEESNRHVMDGSNFSLSIMLKDGTSISARGNNRFPTGYQNAESEIVTLFEDLIDKYGNKYPKTLESDELVYISVYLKQKTEQGEDIFNLDVYAPPGEKIDLDLWIKGYERFWTEGEYRFDGNCETFPFEEFQEIIRRYDVPSWNGWKETVEGLNKEWMQMTLGYATGEEISVMGSRFPEHYEEVRNSFIEITIAFLELENMK